MAISRVRKFELVAHAQGRAEILKVLRGLGSIHISDIEEVVSEPEKQFPSFLSTSSLEVESKLTQIRQCIDFIKRFLSKPSFGEALLATKPVFTAKELESCLTNFKLGSFHKKCMEAEGALADNTARIEKNAALMEDVSHWQRLELPIESVGDTGSTCISLGICESRALTPMTDDLSEATPFYSIETVERSRTSIAMAVAYHKSVKGPVTSILRQYGWHAVSFRDIEGTPAEIVADLQEQNRELRGRNQEIREHITREMVPLRDKLLLLLDHYELEMEAFRVQQDFLFTSRAFLIHGWVIADQEEALRQRLAESTDIVDIRCSDPDPADCVPVLLDNRSMVKPFALITELYGRPQYTEFDPTPLLAPFFIFFFGICLGDAGYGVILALFSYFALKKLQVSGNSRRLLQILFAGGVVNIIVGLLTGGIFGIKSESLPPIFKAMVIFSPTDQVLSFLYLAFLLGVIQVLFGIGVKMAHNLRENRVSEAIMDQGLWLFFLISLVPLIYKNLFGGSVSEGIISPASFSAKIFAVALILTQGRHIKLIILRPLMGLLKLYDTMGYFGDVLSYARLMALGLATAYLGMAFNDMAKMLLKVPYGIGYLLAALLLVFSHIFNLLINCLGAFIHSLRLQYLEFFSKFFAGGGEPFKPFAEEREHTVVRTG